MSRDGRARRVRRRRDRCDFTAEDLAADLVRVLSDRPLALRLGENGRRMEEQRYNWDTQDNVISAVKRELGANAGGAE